MAPSTDPLSIITSSASGLEDTHPTIDESISRPTPPIVTDAEPPEGHTKESWWEWLAHKGEDIENWVDGFIHDHVPHPNDEGGEKDS